jgi:hypothetical protein
MKLDLSHDLLPLLPPIYREVQDYQQICTAEKAEFDLLAGSVEGVQRNFFFQTMDEDSVAQWEKVLHIVAVPEKESLEFRRQRVMTRIATRPPYTLGFLYRKLDELIGAGEWTCSIAYPLYELRIATSAKNQSYYDEVTRLINQIKPAHIVFVSMPYFKTGILITEQVDVQKYDYQYRLGGWALGKKPFAEPGGWTTAKAAASPTLTRTLLLDVAHKAAELAATARLNRTATVKPLKSVIASATLQVGSETLTISGENLKLEASVEPMADTPPTVNHYELLNDAGEALYSSDCYFGVTEKTDVDVNLSILEGADTVLANGSRFFGKDSFASPGQNNFVPVTAATPASASVTPLFLTSLASYLADHINMVQLNGDYTVPNLEKRLSGAEVTLQYDLLPPEKITKVSAISAQDAFGAALTQDDVSIETTSRTKFKHTIVFKEGTLLYGG